MNKEPTMAIASGHTAVQQYQQLDASSKVASASPHRLIQMMMERALTKIGVASHHMERKDVQAKGRNISDAISIINGLQASLNHSASERMSQNFDDLYAYMMRRLLEANLHDDAAILSEVAGLLGELKEAWDAIADQVAETETEPLKS